MGLVDLHLQSCTDLQLCPPNLEILKLATYYKKEENRFCRIINLDEQDLTSYSKIYIYNEFINEKNIPQQFLKANNIIFGGPGFTNGTYIPFNNEIIDFTIPRKDILKGWLKEKYQSGTDAKIITHILDDSYYRLKAGNNILPIPPIFPNKRIFIYDTDIFVDDWQYIFNKIADRRPSRIFMIHPIYCKTVSNFFNLRKNSKIARSNNIIFDFNIPLNETNYLMKSYKKHFLAEIPNNSNIFLELGGSLSTKMQYMKDIIYKLNLYYVFRSNNIPIKFTFTPPKIGITNPFTNLSKLIVSWSMGDGQLKLSINDKTRVLKKDTSPLDEELEIIKYFPKSKTLFYQTLESICKGGTWKI